MAELGVDSNDGGLQVPSTGVGFHTGAMPGLEHPGRRRGYGPVLDTKARSGTGRGALAGCRSQRADERAPTWE